jgi:hypothetical protein
VRTLHLKITTHVHGLGEHLVKWYEARFEAWRIRIRKIGRSQSMLRGSKIEHLTKPYVH